MDDWPMGPPILLQLETCCPPDDDPSLRLAKKALQRLQRAMALEKRAAGSPVQHARDCAWDFEQGPYTVRQALMAHELPFITPYEELDLPGVRIALVGLLLLSREAQTWTQVPMYGRCLVSTKVAEPAVIRVYKAYATFKDSPIWMEAYCRNDSPLLPIPGAIHIGNGKPAIVTNGQEDATLTQMNQATRVVTLMRRYVAKGGRPRGTGTFENGDAFKAVIGAAVQELRARGKNPTPVEVRRHLRTRMGDVDPALFTRWYQRFGWRTWTDFLADV